MPTRSPSCASTTRHPHDPLRLADAQLVVARSYGFPSWPALRRHMDVVGRFARSPHTAPPQADAADELLRLGCVRYGGDSRADQARAAALLISGGGDGVGVTIDTEEPEIRAP